MRNFAPRLILPLLIYFWNNDIKDFDGQNVPMFSGYQGYIQSRNTFLFKVEPTKNKPIWTMIFGSFENSVLNMQVF